MYRILMAAILSSVFVLGCSSDDDSNEGPSCDEVLANDPAGQACPADGCPAVDCVCNDGSSINLSSCFNGVCTGAAACTDACSDSQGWTCDNQSANNQNNRDNNGGMFDCSGETCDAASQYCLRSFVGDVQTTSDCAALPAGCSTCECASDDAPGQFPTTTNCSGVISCSSSNGQISVDCLDPPI